MYFCDMAVGRCRRRLVTCAVGVWSDQFENAILSWLSWLSWVKRAAQKCTLYDICQRTLGILQGAFVEVKHSIARSNGARVSHFVSRRTTTPFPSLTLHKDNDGALAITEAAGWSQVSRPRDDAARPRWMGTETGAATSMAVGVRRYFYARRRAMLSSDGTCDVHSGPEKAMRAPLEADEPALHSANAAVADPGQSDAELGQTAPSNGQRRRQPHASSAPAAVHRLDTLESAEAEDRALSERVDRGEGGALAGPGTVVPPTSTEASLAARVASVIVFAVLGVYLRIILFAATPPGFDKYLTSQVVGSFVLGFVDLFRDRIPHAIFVGVGVGFCGTITTFATWQVDVARNVGFPGAPSDTSARVYAWFAQQFVGLAVPLSAIALGGHCAILAGSAFKSAFDSVFTPEARALVDKRIASGGSILDAAIFGTAFVVLVATCASAAVLQTELTVSLTLGPPAALLRYALALNLNPRSRRFAWGTFVANILGTAIAVMATLLQAGTSSSYVSCMVLAAVQDGFSATLSTISTFVKELRTLAARDSLIYGLGSIVAAQIVSLVSLGVYLNAVGTLDSGTCLVGQG